MAAKTYTSPEIEIGHLDPGFQRADVEFEGVDHSGPSFKAMVFLNNPDANEETPEAEEDGYAGAFHVFGHGGCLGDPGHCEVRGLPRPYDPRPAHPLTPARKIVVATSAVQRLLQLQSKKVTVTVVPVVLSTTPRCDQENVLKFNRLFIVTYR